MQQPEELAAMKHLSSEHRGKELDEPRAEALSLREQARVKAALDIAAQQQAESEKPTPLTPTAESKSYRVSLDKILQSLKDSPRKSRERSISITKIQEAIMWLGMDLKDIGETPNPYPHSYDPKSPVIDKTADGLKL